MPRFHNSQHSPSYGYLTIPLSICNSTCNSSRLCTRKVSLGALLFVLFMAPIIQVKLKLSPDPKRSDLQVDRRCSTSTSSPQGRQEASLNARVLLICSNSKWPVNTKRPSGVRAVDTSNVMGRLQTQTCIRSSKFK